MSKIDSYLVLSTDRDAYVLGSIPNEGWFRLNDKGSPVGDPLMYREIIRRWVNLDYAKNWEDAKRSLAARRESIAKMDPKRRRTTGELMIFYVPTITIERFVDIVRIVEDSTGIRVSDMTFGRKALFVHDVCAEDYQTTGCALAEYVSADCITDIHWTGGVVE